MATYVIGDVHGQYDQLVKLINKLNIRNDDEVYFIGDLIDRGADSIKVIKYLMTIPCTCIAGNHELMMLDSMRFLMQEVDDESIDNLSVREFAKFQDWLINGGKATLDEFVILSTAERKEIIDFIMDFEAYVDIDIQGQRYILVHSGLGNFRSDRELEDYSIDELVWFRSDYEKTYYDDAIIVTGHTPTQFIKCNDRPGYIFKGNNHIAIDCGACSDDGRLAAICLETGEEFYSR